MRKSLYIYAALALVLGASFSAFATGSPAVEEAHFKDWIEPAWVNPLEDVTGQVRIVDIDDIADVQVIFTYPNGKKDRILCDPDKDDFSLFHFAIPAELEAGLGEMTYIIEVLHGSHGNDFTLSEKRSIPMGYEEDLDITANPPDVLMYPLGDETATVRYTACCNIMGASIIAKRMPVNPKESVKGLPAKKDLYSDFVWLEPDDLSASTAGLYFEWSFDPEDFRATRKKVPTIYEYNWMEDAWAPVISYKVVDGKMLDFPSTDGGIYVLSKR